MEHRYKPLKVLGWSRFFELQLSSFELANANPVRIFGLNRHLVNGIGLDGPLQFSLPQAWLPKPMESLPTVGDWVLLNAEGQPLRLLERSSLFKRIASGRDSRAQLMAANVDTLFVVTSCNQEFNLSRLERYLAMALNADVFPVIVLTKIDQAEDPDDFIAQAQTLRPGLTVKAVNAKSKSVLEELGEWCGPGQTVALVGSSGVGKSTLVNTLNDAVVQETGAIRAGDAKGRHTTTTRSLHLLPQGGLLLDSPGLRELQLSDCENGVAALFAEIEALALSCRFKDCRHQGEVGCAIEAAVNRQALDPRRLANYLKLRSEQERRNDSLVDRRRKAKKKGKMYKRIQAMKKCDKNL